MKIKPTISQICAVLFWVLSLALAFKLSANSRYIWVPDTLLLLGFWPLLIGMRARWLWFIFGILNIIIGFALALSEAVPDARFAPFHMVEIKQHLQLCHPFLIWLLVGFFSAAIGVILLMTDLVLWLLKRLKQREHGR